MPRTTKGGDDPHHQLTQAEKDRQERQLRTEARDLLRKNQPKERKERESRAIAISRRESKVQQHH